MKVSIVTVVLNCENFISCCIDSVLMQKHDDIEYIVIDGKSTDGTISRIEKYRDQIHCYISEPDQGFYSALNRGLALATGEIVGILNADDVLANADVISSIVDKFMQTGCDAVYGNLNYTSRNNLDCIIRKWRSKSFLRSYLHFGWMPPHPTLYLKRSIYVKHGCYSMNFGHSADYEFILRLFYKHQIYAVFVDQLFVKMRIGGISNGSLSQLIKGCREDYQAMVFHQLPFPFISAVGKKFRKIEQFL